MKTSISGWMRAIVAMIFQNHSTIFIVGRAPAVSKSLSREVHNRLLVHDAAAQQQL